MWPFKKKQPESVRPRQLVHQIKIQLILVDGTKVDFTRDIHNEAEFIRIRNIISARTQLASRIDIEIRSKDEIGPLFSFDPAQTVSISVDLVRFYALD